MTSHIKLYLLVFLVSFLSSWFYLSYHVQQNTHTFHPDEMYWVGAARIIPLLQARSSTDPFWKEYFGYANFNGGKLLYGLSLWGLGYRDRDYTFAGYPPNTYYQFSEIKGPYPENSSHYPILRDARMVNTLFASLSIGLFASLALLLFGDILTAFLSAFVLIVHPIFQSIAMIALTDAFFLFCELLFFVLLEVYITVSRSAFRAAFAICLGGTAALLTAIQPFGLVFAALVPFYAVTRHKRFGVYDSGSVKKFFFDIVLFMLSAGLTFALLHPNFFFPDTAGPLEIITSKIMITRYHMMYYLQVEPGRVLLTIPERVLASFNALFQGSLVGLLSALSGIVLLLRSFRVPYENELRRLVVSACYLYVMIILLLVFNESRFLLPLLPFLILFSVYIFAAASRLNSIDRKEK